MKVHVELHRNDLVLAAAAVIAVCLTTGYYVYRETQIRMTLVEQAKAENYGQGVLQATERYARRLKRHK